MVPDKPILLENPGRSTSVLLKCQVARKKLLPINLPGQPIAGDLLGKTGGGVHNEEISFVNNANIIAARIELTRRPDGRLRLETGIPLGGIQRPKAGPIAVHYNQLVRAAFGLGILVASRMRSQQGFQIVVQIIIFPLIFLSGVFFPVNNVPTWLEVISKINPLTYGVDAIRQLFLGGKAATMGGVIGQGDYTIGVTVFGHTMTILEDVLIVAVLGIVMMATAVWSFSKQE